MKRFVYLLAEGVQDVAFLGKILSLKYQGVRRRHVDELEATHAKWLMSQLSWPPKNKSGQSIIDRFSVPAPAWYGLADDGVVAIRNAVGLSGLKSVLAVDFAVFERENIVPDAIGIVLDSNGASVEQRYAEMASALRIVGLPVPQALGKVSDTTPRTGMFTLPAPGVPGCLEDVLMALGDVAHPKLVALARHYIDSSLELAKSEPAGAHWGELLKPAGTKKATIGTTTAVLKPGKATQVSIEDGHWVNEATLDHASIQPCLEFLKALIGTEPGIAP